MITDTLLTALSYICLINAGPVATPWTAALASPPAGIYPISYTILPCNKLLHDGGTALDASLQLQQPPVGETGTIPTISSNTCNIFSRLWIISDIAS